jgi:CBS domain-containing protein
VLEMARNGIRQLPVVHHDDARRLAGILAMSDVSAYLERQRSVVER